MDLGWADHTKILQEHQVMLADRARVEAYREAIHELVEPGDVVVDLGTGTGLLAYFACQAGAARVYGIERGPILRVAEEVRRANGFEDRVIFVSGQSTQEELPERADVLISEILWSFGVGEGIIGSILDARERFLKPGGRMLPLGFEMLAAPAELPRFYSQVTEPEDDYGLDLSPLRTYALSNMYPTPIPADSLLSEPVALQRFDLLGDLPPEASGSATAHVARDGVVHGVVGWFSAQLTPSVTITNPPSPKRSNWAQVFFPLSEPVEVEAGHQVGIRMQTSANGSVWRWNIDISGADEGGPPHRTDATSFFGFPFDFEPGREEVRTG